MNLATLHRGVATDPFIGRVLGGRFKVVEKIGEGGMSRIYRAESTESGGETVAVKVLHGYLQKQEEAVARFHNEVKAASKIGHPAIINVLDSGAMPDGTVYMIQELLKGEDWGEVLERSGAQPIGHAIRVIRQVCDGVGAAHEKGIIHRDLKPANVFLHERKSGKVVVKVLDFGVSKMRDDNQQLTATDSTMGTVAYMSPEQLRGAKFVDARSDIWAIGIMLYEALAGHKPFEADTMALTATKVFKDPTPRLRAVRPDVPVGLWKVVYKLLQKSPDKRFQTCAEVKEALAPYIDLETTAIVQDAQPMIMSSRTGSYMLAGVAVAVVSLVAVLWWSLSDAEPQAVLPDRSMGNPPVRMVAEESASANVGVMDELPSGEALEFDLEDVDEADLEGSAEGFDEEVEDTPASTMRRRHWMRRVPMQSEDDGPMMRTMVQISVMDF